MSLFSARHFSRYATAFGLGALMPFLFSPFDQIWLAPLLLAGWLKLLMPGRAISVGYAFGLGWFGLGAWWLASTLHTYGHLPWLVAAFCVLLVGCVMAALPALLAWLCWRTAGRSNWILIAFPAATVLEEWLRGHLFTGLPWTALGNLLLDTPAVGWASWFGVYGAAALPALAAATLVLLSMRRWRPAATGLIAIMLLMLLAPAPYTGVGDMHRATLVQGDIPQDHKWDRAFVGETMHRYADLSASAAGSSDLIIWPEAAVPFFLERAPGWSSWLDAQINDWQTPLLFGGLKLTGGKTAQNGLMAEDPAVPGRQFAGKQHLVPFGEYVPSWIPFLHTLVPEIANFRPAEDSGVVSIRGHRYGALICYESLFPEQARSRVLNGANVLVNVTNDAWYGTTPAAWQHFQAARMRAVETGRYVLRAANTGITAAIGPDGQVRDSLPWWTQGALTVDYQLSDKQTPYVRWGDWPLLATLMMLIVAWLRSRQDG
ncbi:apolipoprotein N-acyltransferase [Mariprofundus ferrooxydans]|nr:apolipoprotein N-acyltransferase [Mariprofundus ferrooxydans]KON47309.1 apolipoprotein acyltransferase [Mariprofundus ferrooxydans]